MIVLIFIFISKREIFRLKNLVVHMHMANPNILTIQNRYSWCVYCDNLGISLLISYMFLSYDVAVIQ